MSNLFSSTGLLFVIIGVILVAILILSNRFDSHKFISDNAIYFTGLMEDDYKFLLNVKYGREVDVEQLFNLRVRNALVVMVVFFIFALNQMSFALGIVCLLIGFGVFKLPYIQLKNYYRANLNKINLMLPYYLKGLEILIQHYTVPVALARSIESAPEIFVPGLKRLVSKIDAGDSSVQPYMDFAGEYPVRDSMRMMRLLYRLGLGSQENKQDQLLMFSRTISALQNKAREQKYKERLDKMERKTMIMLFGTGGGILLLLLLSMMMMMNY